MENDAVQDTGLAPQESGPGQQPQESPGEQGKDTVPVQEMRKLYRELKKWKEKYRELEAHRGKLESREKALAQLRSRIADMHLERLLTDSASAQDAINPQQVASFLRPRVVLGDDLELVVLVPETEKENGDTNPANVEELVSEFLSRYPYHRKAKLSGGAGSTPSPRAVSETLKTQIQGASSHRELEKIISRKQP